MELAHLKSWEIFFFKLWNSLIITGFLYCAVPTSAGNILIVREINLYELHFRYTISHTSPQLSPLLWAPAPGNTSQEEWYSVWSWLGGDQWPLGYHLVVLVARLVCAASPSSGGLCRPGTRPSLECISTRREKTCEWSGILISFNDNLTPVSLHKIGKGRSKWENYHAWRCFC